MININLPMLKTSFPFPPPNAPIDPFTDLNKEYIMATVAPIYMKLRTLYIV
jgi:hypothetical protein